MNPIFLPFKAISTASSSSFAKGAPMSSLGMADSLLRLRFGLRAQVTPAANNADATATGTELSPETGARVDCLARELIVEGDLCGDDTQNKDVDATNSSVEKDM